MTRQRPNVKRTVQGRPQRPVDPSGYVATLHPDGVELKPLRARKPESTVYATWDQIYKWGLIAQVPALPRRKGRRRKARK